LGAWVVTETLKDTHVSNVFYSGFSWVSKMSPRIYDSGIKEGKPQSEQKVSL
jgi:hypothetical protein